MRTRLARCCLASVALAWAGCSDGESETPPPPAPGSCDVPNRLVDGACREPGVQDGGCPAGELALESGGCLRAGLAPELCAEGFTFDEVARTCEPVLPLDVCADGTMALPGETACRPVMVCGSGSWGDIPVEANTVYVDGSYSAGASDGSQGAPFVTVSDGLDFAPVGAIVAVAAGTYVEDVTIRRAVRLWGICPDQVDVVATGADASGLVVTAASGAEIRGIAVRHPNNGAALVVFDSVDVVVEQVRAHDSGVGIALQDVSGPVSITIRDSLLDTNDMLGLLMDGATATLERVSVRGNRGIANPQAGLGIQAQSGLGAHAPSALTVRHSLVEDNQHTGISVLASHADLEALVVRNTIPAVAGDFGRGINIETNDPDIRPNLRLRSAFVEGNHEAGVVAAGTDAVIEGIVVRGVLPREVDGGPAGGVMIQFDELPPTAAIRNSVLELNHGAGLSASGSVVIEGVIARGNLPEPKDQFFGRGFNIQYDPRAGQPSHAVLLGSISADNHDLGLYVAGSEVHVEGLLVQRTRSRVRDQTSGRGINIQESDDQVRSLVLLSSSIVEDSFDLGVMISGSDVTVVNTAVRNSAPRASDHLYGDGISVIPELAPATLQLTHSLLTGNARAGLASFGSVTTLSGNRLACNTIDIDAEPYAASPPQLTNEGGNLCGCDEGGECSAVSASLAPPARPEQ